MNWTRKNSHHCSNSNTTTPLPTRWPTSASPIKFEPCSSASRSTSTSRRCPSAATSSTVGESFAAHGRASGAESYEQRPTHPDSHWNAARRQKTRSPAFLKSRATSPAINSYDPYQSPIKPLARRLRASFSICRTRSRVSPSDSPISLSVFGSESSRPNRIRRIVASRGSIVSSIL